MSTKIDLRKVNVLAPWKTMLLKAKLRNKVTQKKKRRLCGELIASIAREEELLLDEDTGDAEGPKGKAGAKEDQVRWRILWSTAGLSFKAQNNSHTLRK